LAGPEAMMEGVIVQISLCNKSVARIPAMILIGKIV
jgi:hypothetical protein